MMSMEDNTQYIVKTSFKRMLSRVQVSGLLINSSIMINAILVAHFLGTESMAITALAIPLWHFAEIFSGGLNYGSSILFMHHLGDNNKKAASDILCQSFTMTLIVAFLFMIIGSLLSPLLTSLTGVDESMYDTAVHYNRFLFIALGATIVCNYTYFMVNADSNPTIALIGSVIKVALFILLSILFMGVFDWGIASAMYALVIAEVVGALIMLSHFFLKKTLFRLSLMRPSKKNLKHIFSFTTHFSIEVAAAIIMMMILNNLLMKNFSIEIVSIYLMIVTFHELLLSLYKSNSLSMMPLLGTFYGEKNTRGIEETLKIGLKSSMVISAIVCVALVVLSPFVPELYSYQYPEYLKMAMIAVALYAISVPFYMLVNNAVFSMISVNKLEQSLILGVVNTFVFPVLIGLVVVWTHSITLLWLLFAISGVLSVLGLGVYLYKKRNQKLDQYLHIEDKSHSFSAQFCILIKPEDIANMEDYQEMADMFLMVQNIDEKRQIRCKLILGEIMEYAQQTNQGENDYVDIQMGVLAEGQVRIMVKLDNDTVGIANVESGDENFLSLEIMRNASSTFKYNRVMTFNTFDMVV